MPKDLCRSSSVERMDQLLRLGGETDIRRSVNQTVLEHDASEDRWTVR